MEHEKLMERTEENTRTSVYDKMGLKQGHMTNMKDYNRKPGSNKTLKRPTEPANLNPGFKLKSPASVSQLESSFYDTQTGHLPGI
jgi:hypothetical protein